MACFQAVDAIIAPEQTVPVRLANVVVGEMFFSVERIVLRVIVDDRAGQHRQVIGC